jgi:hypothetical protein
VGEQVEVGSILHFKDMRLDILNIKLGLDSLLMKVHYFASRFKKSIKKPSDIIFKDIILKGKINSILPVSKIKLDLIPI